MKIAIFGGTGTSGLLTIEKALKEGHEVTAYARKPEKITFKHENLTVVKGELTEYDKIEKVIGDVKAVISLLGPTGKAKDTLISNGYRNIITAMKKHGVKRLITAVSTSYRDPQDKFSFMVSFGVVMLKVVGASILKDILTMGDLIKNSQLDWTMARLPMLKNNPEKGKIHIGYTGDGRFNFFELTRADLANFLVRQLTENTYLYAAPAISN
ncbi:SDR family oxidoreductase [Chryseobacterium indologenes]|uniref:NAD(P)-dependent oxidoreductase n=1 Tax=Chryseobacterium indologenes TaxID=253 RepID=UPI0011080B44|nr:SDR family oxidoreductase [Chryseobacterium indologenes]TLX26618.1 SDR family oxidoreductase [Chryseobacterium indologenes]